MEIKNLQALGYELRRLHDKAHIYRENNEYIYANVYDGWVKEYNSLLEKYNALAELQLNPMSYTQSDLSSTQKTVRDAAAQYFIKTMESLADKIETDIEAERVKSKEVRVPNHQMRKCFKLDIDNCPLNPDFNKRKIFVAMPFDNKYLDSYNYGIVPALNSLGFEHYKADNDIRNKDIMCKICKQIQSCRLAIINISGLNPNVMLEYGMVYGLGKSVIIIKDKDTKAISDIGCIEYIEYEHAHHLMEKLSSALNSID
ncbi:MAG: nucleotide-binding protein [Oscillospiraceae bacterium]|jgi:hypothetical protein|nr:nucleotide-binding protein [Oscillospiraceae bacterium]